MMKKKNTLLIAILLMAIGFATIATTMYINGSVLIAGDQEAFDGDVIFTNASVSGGDASISQNGKTITFVTADLKSLNQVSTLVYTVTNNSTQYDARVEVVCGYDNTVNEDDKKYISWENTLNSVVEARSSEDGTVDVKLTSVTESEKEIKLACTLTATPEERTIPGEGEEVEIPENLIRGIAKLNRNGNLETLSSGNLVFFSDNHLESTISSNGSFEVSGLENGSHEVYYMGDVDPSNLTKEEIDSQATGYAKFATSTTESVIELTCINNKCPAGTTFVLDDVEIEKVQQLDTLYNKVKNGRTPTEDEISKKENKTHVVKTEEDDFGVVYTSNYTDYVVFANKCWTVLRTTGTQGVKIEYYSDYKNGECNSTPSFINTAFNAGTMILLSDYNISVESYDNAFVGYMYGTPESDTYEATHANINNSTLKTKIDKWYEDNLISYTNQIEDTIYCNDRSYEGWTQQLYDSTYSSYGRWEEDAGHEGIGLTATLYRGYYADHDLTITNLKCPQNNDKFTVSSSIGNGALTYPIAVTTMQEINFAENEKLFNGYSRPNMTPYLFNEISGAGPVMSTFVYVRVEDNYSPVISLKYPQYVSSGTGTFADPYVIQ